MNAVGGINVEQPEAGTQIPGLNCPEKEKDKVAGQ
jgi:hypothetical protein